MGWTRFFRRAKWDADRAREIDAYIQLETDENIARGMNPADAKRAAQRRLGNKTQVREEIYRMNSVAALETLSQDFRYALRGLARQPAFTVVALITLALGIGANTAIFSVVNSVLIRPLSYPKPGELVSIWHKAPGMNFKGDLNVAPSMYLTYRDQNRMFQGVGAWWMLSASVTGRGEPEQVRTLIATHDVLPVLGVRPMLGRWFSENEISAAGPGAAPNPAVLTYGYWQRKFGGDKSAVGRTMTIDGRAHFVVGVMPDSFRFLSSDPELILPVRFDPSRMILADFSYHGLARLKPGVTLEQANADIARMQPIWRRSWPAPGGNVAMVENWKIQPALRPLKQDVVGDTGEVLWVVMGTVGLVLLIACANIANLLLVRAEGRRQDLAVRAALGAGRGRIVRGLLVESLVLGLAGGAIGVVLAFVAVRALIAVGPANLPRLSEVSIDLPTLAFAVAASLVSSLLFGLLPALKYAASETARALSATRTASHSRERHRSRNTLVVVQVALALVLLVSSGLMIRTFQAMRNVKPGFTKAEGIQTVRIDIPQQDPERVARIENAIQDKLRAIPGVTSVAFASALPMDGLININPIYIEGQDPGVQTPPVRRYKWVSPGLHAALGTRLVAGRDMNWAELYAYRPVAMISENLAREFWGSASGALGKRISDLTRGEWREIVGVVEDVRDDGVRETAPTIVYWPVLSKKFFRIPVFVQRSVSFTIRTPRAGTESLMNEVRQAVWSVNSNLPLARVQTMEEIYNKSMASTSFTLVMLALAGGMALLLGVVGIYGVISYAVSQRRREIGIRLALGAQQRELRRMFVRYGLALSGAGAAIGLAAALALSRLISSLLFGVSPFDPVTFIAVPLVLITAALAASYLPARRASSVNPTEALKAD